MPKKFLPILLVVLAASAVLILENFLLTHNVALFNPQGEVALRQRSLIITAVLLMLVVIIPLLVSAYIFAWKYREDKNNKYEPDGSKRIWGGMIWGMIPAVIVGALMVMLWKGAHGLDPYRPLQAAGVKPLTIQVISLDWKWLFIYPEQGIATVNFIEFPENTPLNFELTADNAPMSSFWIPQLGGQVYTMTGMKTQLHLIANKTGEYRGQSAEINGDGFSGMRFSAKSSSQEEFEAWVNSVKNSKNQLSSDEYAKLIKPSEDNPVAYYSSISQGFFNGVIMKYMSPGGTIHNMEGM